MMFTILFTIALCVTDNNYFIIAILFAIVIEAILAVCISDWLFFTGHEMPRLTFKQFIRIYSAVPRKFVLLDDHIIYRSKAHDLRVNMKTPLDLLRYKIFYRNRKKYDKRMKEIRAQADLIKAIQEDLNKQQEEITDFVREKSVL